MLEEVIVIFIPYLILCIHGLSNNNPKTYNLHGKPGEGYYIEVYIGTPPQMLNVLLDTGSSNFAIATSPNSDIDKYFVVTNSTSYLPKNIDVSVPYTQGSWSGTLGNDILQFPSLPNTPIVNCDIASIEKANHFYMKGAKWQGILGLAYPLIARPDASVTPWFDKVVDVESDEDMPNVLRHVPNVFSVELCGSVGPNKTHQGIFLAGISGSSSVDAHTTPIAREWFYDVILTNIGVGKKTLDLPCVDYNNDKTIIDSGTTNLRLPKKVFDALTAHLHNIEITNLTIPDAFWTNQEMMCLEKDQLQLWSQFPPISLHLAHSNLTEIVISLTAKSYIRKVLDDAKNDTDSVNCYKFALDSIKRGTILGVVVLEGLKVTFNRTGRYISFRPSQCGPPVYVLGPYETNFNTKTCAYVVEKGTSSIVIAAYVLAALSMLCVIPILYFLFDWLRTTIRKRKFRQTFSRVSLISDT